MATITSTDGTAVVPQDHQCAGALPLSSQPAKGRFGPLLAFGLALVVYVTAALMMRPLPTGDEPHYLLYAYTLVHTGGVNLRPSYANEVARRFYPESLSPAGHAFDYRHDGRLISVHDIGLPVLIAPVVYLTNSVLAVRLEMVVISALAAWQLFLLLRELGVVGPRYTWLAFGATALSMPFLAYSNQIYPDVPAALLVVYAARAIASRKSRSRSLFLAALAAAALPWLHVRYLALTIGLILAVLIRFLRRRSVRSAVLSFGLLLASMLLMAVAFAAWYGSPLPSAPYGGVYQGNAQLTFPSPASLYFFGLGELLNSESGWLPFAPVQVIGVIGLAVWARRFPRRALWALVFIGGYLLVTTGANGVGQSFPSRYLIPVVLLIAVPLALALQVNRPIRYAFAGLMVLSVAIAGMAVLYSQDLYPRSNTLPTGRTVLPVAANVQNLWPTFQAANLPTGFQLSPDQTPRRVGKLISTATPDQSSAMVAYATPEQYPAGFLSYGPNDLLQAGQYQASFTLAAAGQHAAQPAVTLDVRVEPGDVVARRELKLADFPPDQSYATFSLPFTLSEPGTIEARVYYEGQTAVWLSKVAVTPVAVAPPAADAFPDWPISLLWVLGTATAALVLLRSDGGVGVVQLPTSSSSGGPRGD